MRIFLSYGHDEHAAVASRLKQDLEKIGHEVWFDLDRLSPGGDWETYIEKGLEFVAEKKGQGRLILLMTPYSVRRPDGYCLNEVARAVQREISIVPVMITPCDPPLSIARLQWLDMQDVFPWGKREERYLAKLELLKQALTSDTLVGEGIQARLVDRLKLDLPGVCGERFRFYAARPSN
jgi:hypothetical protein